MGYYTHFDLIMHPKQDTVRELEIMRVIASKIDKKDPADISDDDAKWCLSDHLKWYDHHDHMVEVSKQFPDIIFVLCGEGEESDDIWQEYFTNGEYEEIYAEIVYPKPTNPKFKNL
jgi:hypothetical protein